MNDLRSLMPSQLIDKIGSAATAIQGERREVTVLFLDVMNFTAASHRLDSEDVYLIIGEAMRLLVEIIYKYEGAVDKFTGDGLMALFGAPVAHENDPERAVRAALEMQEILKPLRQHTLARFHFNLQARIGINTGLVIAGQLGSNLHMEYTVIGDTVNLASRLESAAEPGTILTSFSTYQRTRPFFHFVTLPPLHLKGFVEPVRAYRPLQVREQPGNVRGLPGLRVPMIGRTDDLARIHALMDGLVTDHRRRVALVTGEAGVGKSRLVSEFTTEIGKRSIPVYRGTCLAYTRSRPLWVVADLLRDILPISETDAVEDQPRILGDFIADLGLDQEQTLPYLLPLLGLPQTDPGVQARLRMMEASLLQKQTHVALRRVLLAVAQEPTVVILEDLHWMDGDSRAFLELLIRTSAGAPILFILISREGEGLMAMQPLADLVQHHPSCIDDIRLKALTPEERRRLVDQLIQPSSPEVEHLKATIVRRAEGNPFYTEEIVRMLMDQGGLENIDGNWRVTATARQLLEEIPGTLRGLILARFDELPPPLRRTLQKAAVLGRSFPVSLLETLWDGAPDRLREHLSLLTARHFLAPEPFGAEPGFAFRHTLIQKAVYGTLLRRDRRRLHGLVAQAIEQASCWFPDDQAEILAHHFSKSANPERAVPYLWLAAESASRGSAPAQTAPHHGAALDVRADHDLQRP